MCAFQWAYTQGFQQSFQHPCRKCQRGRFHFTPRTSRRNTVHGLRSSADQSHGQASGGVKRERPLVSRFASSGLYLLIHSLCKVAEGLEVDVDAASNRDLLTGKLRGVTVRATRVVFGSVPISGSIAVFVPSLELPLAKAVAVSVVATATEADLNAEGSAIRALLERLLKGVVSNSVAGMLGRATQGREGEIKTKLDKVVLEDPSTSGFDVLKAMLFGGQRGGRLVLHASSTFGSRMVDYQVRAGLSVRERGTVVIMDDPVLTWRGLPVPLGASARVGVKFEDHSQLTSVEISADGLFCEVCNLQISFVSPLGSNRDLNWLTICTSVPPSLDFSRDYS